MHLGGNWVSILNAIPQYVRRFITFKPDAPPPAVNDSMNLVAKVMGACFIDDVSFTKTSKGKYWLKLFRGIWWQKDGMIIYGMPNNMATFEEVFIFWCTTRTQPPLEHNPPWNTTSFEAQLLGAQLPGTQLPGAQPPLEHNPPWHTSGSPPSGP